MTSAFGGDCLGLYNMTQGIACDALVGEADLANSDLASSEATRGAAKFMAFS